MNEICKRFAFARDMNGDLAYTISDLWLQFKMVFLLPSNFAASILHDWPGIGSFLEIDCMTGRGALGWMVSALVWFALLVFVSAVLARSTQNARA